MSQVIRTLLIDDDVDYSISLIGDGRRNSINIIHETNWETGFARLKDDPGIEFLILDGKCLLEEDQEKPKNNFLGKVLPDLKVFEVTHNRPIPLCVNTGFFEKFGEDHEGNARVFGKGQDNKPMFEFIKEEVAKTDIFRYKLTYASAFRAFSEDLILPIHLSKLITLIRAIEGEREIEKQLFEVIRELIEEIFRSLQVKFNHFKDYGVFFHPDGRPNLNNCERYLAGLNVTDRNSGRNFQPEFETPKHISRTITFLTTTSSVLSHNYSNNFTSFTFKSAAYALLEVLSWLPEYLKENYAD